MLQANDARPRLRDLARPGVAAVRANWRPFVLLQLAALAVVVLYYNVDAARRAVDAAGRLRAEWGVAFTMLAAAVAGGLLPEVAKAVTRTGWRPGGRRGELLFLIALFAFNGALVDGFYWSLGATVGEGTDAGTVVVKMLVDMLGFTPAIALPLVMLAFAWRRHGFRIAAVTAEVRSAGVGGWYLRRVVPLLLPDWAFWGPMVLLIYAMPGGLQVVMWAGALAAWSLVMVFIGNDDHDATPIDVPPPE